MRVDLGLGEPGGHFVEQQQPRPRAQRHADLQQALLRRRDGGRGQRRQRRRGRSGCRIVVSLRSRAGGARSRPANCEAERARCRPRSSRRTRAASGRCARCRAPRSGARRAPVRSPAEHEQLARRSARCTPDSALKKVVLPAPLGPMMPTSSPGPNAALTRVDGDEPAEAHRDAARLEQRVPVHAAPLRTECHQARVSSRQARNVAGRSDARPPGRYSTHGISSTPEHHHVAVGHLQPQRLGEQAEHQRGDERPAEAWPRRRSARSARSGSR